MQPLSDARREFLKRSLASVVAGGALISSSHFALSQEPSQEGPPGKGDSSKGATPSEQLLSIHDEHMQWPPGWVGNEQIVMLLYPGFTALDVFGPHHMFVLLMGAKVHLVAKTSEPVLTDTGIAVKPTMTFAECPDKPTVFFVPGGTGGTLDAANDKETRDFVTSKGAKSDFITSVCTGSVLLGAGGLLKGYKATSHWITRDLLSEFGATPVDERVVVDRNRITGAGVTAGLDFALKLVKVLRTEQYAEAVQLFAEYDPQPPIDKGSVGKASADLSGLLLQMHEPFRQMVRDLAKR